jgi:co-chaperonin GroES (HSP10)
MVYLQDNHQYEIFINNTLYYRVQSDFINATINDNMIKPTSDRVLVEPILEKKVSGSGLEIPNLDPLRKGNVLAVGKGRDGKPMVVKSGMTVMYAKNAGLPIGVQDKVCLLMNENDIHLIL